MQTKTIKELCEKYKITNYTINPDGSIDVDGDVDLFDKHERGKSNKSIRMEF